MWSGRRSQERRLGGFKVINLLFWSLTLWTLWPTRGKRTTGGVDRVRVGQTFCVCVCWGLGERVERYAGLLAPGGNGLLVFSSECVILVLVVNYQSFRW